MNWTPPSRNIPQVSAETLGLRNSAETLGLRKPSPFPTRDLSNVINTLDTVKNAQKNTPALWNPQVQLQLASQNIGKPVSQPHTYGSSLMNFANTNTQDASQNYNKSLFYQNYINPRSAQKDYETNVSNVKKVFATFDTTGKKCHVYPPLLIRYADQQSQFIPIEILPLGEIKITAKIPDIILNFHADSKAITFTTCEIDKKKIPDFNIFITAVYSMFVVDTEKTFDIHQFTVMYDQERYSLLKATNALMKYNATAI